jgi:hypothetical protein
VLAVPVLLFGFGSAVDEAAFAELVMTVPDVAPDGTLTTRVNVVDAPDASEARVQLMVPAALTAGVVQIHAVPVCARDLNVVVLGVPSVKVFVAAAAGPLFFTTIV